VLSEAELVPSVQEWLTTADDLDLVATTRSLVELLASMDPAWTGADRLRARLLIFSGAAEQARLLLPTADPFDISAVLSELSLLQACTAASTGDERAYRYLQGAFRELSGGGDPPWLVSYTTAVSAEYRHDNAIADTLWTRLVRQENIVTPITLPRAAAAAVMARDGSVRERVAVLRQFAASFDSLPLSPAADPAPVLLAADLLRRRNDSPGAALLLFAVLRRHKTGNIPSMEQALAKLGIVMAGRKNPKISPTVLLERIDRRTRRGIARRDVPEWRFNALIHMFMAAALSFSIGVAAAGFYTDAHPHGSATVITLVWLTGVFGLPILAARGAAWILTRFPDTMRPRSDSKRIRRVPACQCLNSRIIRGPTVIDYLDLHLQVAHLASASSTLPDFPRLRTCPDTAIAWMVLPDQTGKPALLIRGAAPMEQDPEQRTPPIGMYL
jgi:hypothetical protein